MQLQAVVHRVPWNGTHNSTVTIPSNNILSNEPGPLSSTLCNLKNNERQSLNTGQICNKSLIGLLSEMFRQAHKLIK